tara:strand:- start:210 stop:1709 length:1500 start_codon:yes stop_codon:yes gene_type:complete
MKLPPYVSIKNKTTYRYSRAYPIKIRRRLSQCPIKYDRTLQLKVGCSEAELNKAVAREAKSYELKVKGLTVSDPNAYSQSEKEILASDILRRAEVTDGEFSLIKDAEEAFKKAEAVINPNSDIVHNMHKKFKEESGVTETVGGNLTPEIEVTYKSGLTIKEEAELIALRALLDIKAPTIQTLDALYDGYIKANKMREKDREGKNRRATICTDEFMSIIGNQETTNELNQKLNKALQLYMNKRLKDGNRVTGETIKPQSVDRELSYIMNFLNHINEANDYEWALKRPKIKHEKKKEKGVIEPEEQTLMINYIISEERTKEEKLYGCMILIYLHAGVMASEIERFDLGLCFQDEEFPYLFTADHGKNENREERLIPIVFQVDFIKEHLEEAQALIKRKKATNMSKPVARFMRKILNDTAVSPHWLRHTYKSMSDEAEVPIVIQNMIGGWKADKDETSKAKQDYARGGLRKKRLLERIFMYQKKTFHYLIENQNDNVVKLFS